ncbi:MAG: DUF3604 domain-containing protein, partial [Acidobacteriaceae bacterium]|nr:DUF3604 domain-containing protein [Acidobacteriaceae bacterium]
GNRNDPRQAYRFGRGEEVTLPGGQKSKLRVPLDFMAVTDHDIWLGEVSLCNDASSDAYKTQICEMLREADQPAKAQGTKLIWRFAAESAHKPSERDKEICGSTDSGPDTLCAQRANSVWKQIQKNADDFYEPGKFTTFAAFEWTANLDRIGMLHRNVIFRGGHLPESIENAIQLNNSPERLWEWLQRSCQEDCEVVSIPHNTNFGWGVALDTKNSDGTPFTKEILQNRAKSEPLIEIHQIKGNSECAPGLGTNDEQCNFEQLFQACKAGQQAFCAVARDYVRNALKSGLLVDEQYGINPFKYGFIGSTDTHSSNPGSADEKGWTGGSGLGDATPAQRLKAAAAVSDEKFPIKPLAFNPGGLAGVWAEENTREAIFRAFKRRETFATSGPRFKVRLFAGWDYPQDLERHRNAVSVAYRDGVAMGSDLPPAHGKKPPRLLAWAVQDPDGPSLQKLQIIKGWTRNGQAFEAVYDIACSGGAKPDPTSHRCPDNGATVDLHTCETAPAKGSAELASTWIDPTFDVGERSFYYVRVIANPSCRWTTYDAIAAGQEPPKTVPATVQERAWSSPVWYTPPSEAVQSTSLRH